MALSEKGFVELPYTLPQDSTIFILMQEENIDIWKEKLDWIAEKGGMALLNTHPDYMDFKNGKQGIKTYPANFYIDLLKYIKTRYNKMYWHVLSEDIASFWKKTIVEKDLTIRKEV